MNDQILAVKELKHLILTPSPSPNFKISSAPGGGGGDSHMKQIGMPIVSLRDVNFGLWSCLGLFQAKHQYFKQPRSRLGFCTKTQNYTKRNRSQIFFLTCFVYCITSVIINQRFLQIVESPGALQSD